MSSKNLEITGVVVKHEDVTVQIPESRLIKKMIDLVVEKYQLVSDSAFISDEAHILSYRDSSHHGHYHEFDVELRYASESDKEGVELLKMLRKFGNDIIAFDTLYRADTQ